MTTLAQRLRKGSDPFAMEFAVHAAPTLDVAERAVVRGIQHGLRHAGLDARLASAGPGRVALLFATADTLGAQLDGFAGDVPDSASPTAQAVVAVVMPRKDGDLARFLEHEARVDAFWTLTEWDRDRLRESGATAHCIGVGTQLGAARYRARATLGLRDEDFVFFVRITETTPSANRELVRQAWAELDRYPSTRFARSSLYVQLADGIDPARWHAWKAALNERAVVVGTDPRDPLDLQAVHDLCDAEICAQRGPAFSWTAARCAARGLPLVSVGSRADADPCARLDVPRTLVESPEQLADAIREIRGRGFADPHGAPSASSSLDVSARGVACRALTALRGTRVWDALVGKKTNDADRD